MEIESAPTSLGGVKSKALRVESGAEVSQGRGKWGIKLLCAPFSLVFPPYFIIHSSIQLPVLSRWPFLLSAQDEGHACLDLTTKKTSANIPRPNFATPPPTSQPANPPTKIALFVPSQVHFGERSNSKKNKLKQKLWQLFPRQQCVVQKALL